MRLRGFNPDTDDQGQNRRENECKKPEMIPNPHIYSYFSKNMGYINLTWQFF